MGGNGVLFLIWEVVRKGFGVIRGLRLSNEEKRLYYLRGGLGGVLCLGL